MPFTDVGIFNKALLSLGEETEVTAVDGSDTSPLGKKAFAFYADTRDEEIRLRKWIFAISRALAVASADPNLTGWAYSYALPADSLRVLGIYVVGDAITFFPFSMGDQQLDYRFKIEGKNLYCNLGSDSASYFKYLKRITDPTLFDASFEPMLVARLAIKLCMPVTQDAGRLTGLENTYATLLKRAGDANALEAEDDHEGEGNPWWTDRLYYGT